jgi:PEP-CTERM motif
MKQLGSATAALATVAAICCVSVAANATSFNFDGLPADTGTSFVLIVDGLSATFSASADPNGFQVTPAISLPVTSSGNVLIEPDGSPYQALTISFSAPISSFSATFATTMQDPLYLTAFNGGLGTADEVGSTSATGTVALSGDMPEGTISFDGAMFDRVILASGNDPAFALSTITVASIDSVPEPSSLALLATSVAGLGLLRRRRML